MISIFAFVLLSQLKVGDKVYVPPGIPAYMTAEDAVVRRNGVETPYQNGDVIAVKTVDGEQVVRIKREGYELPVWAIMEQIRILDDAAKEMATKYLEQSNEQSKRELRGLIGASQAKQKMEANNQVIKRLKPYCITKPEHEALSVAVMKELDPITMTAEQAQSLSPSQRKALSSIKARYLKARKK